MYRVYCDDKLLYDPRIEELKINNAKLNLELNKTSSFSFEIFSQHPYFDSLKKLKSIIKVYQNDYLCFRGRILDDEEGLYNDKKVTCEGELAFLLDSVSRPYEHKGTVKELFEKFINQHNEQVEEVKQFKIGRCTVVDKNNLIVRSNIEYSSIWKELEEKLIKKLDGYIFIRHEDDGNYIDYLSDFDILNAQDIEFGKNLLDFKNVVDASEIATIILPVGKADETTKERLTVKEVNNGKDYVADEDAIKKYGKIFKVVHWDDVTVADNLLRKAKEYLSKSILLSNTITLDAVDLSALNLNISNFKIGQKNRVKSSFHNIDTRYLVNRLSVDLLNPKSNKLTMGATTYSFTEQSKNNFDKLKSDYDSKLNSTKQDTITELTTEFETKIKQTEKNIKNEVSENTYTKNETKELIKEVSTSVEQTKDSFNFKFKNFEKDLGSLQNSTDNKFLDIERYIRFKNGTIELGEKNNPLILKIKNNRIQFIQNNAEVAYFSENKLYVLDGEFIHSLRLGQFAFIPRENGNLSFKKVGK